MSKRPNWKFIMKLSMPYRKREEFADALAVHESSDKRVNVKIKKQASALSIIIKAADINILMSASNSILNGVRMLDEIDKVI
ncbi:MAG: hypothetical protein M1573_02250 [Candidatus Parvarchaeota archaeon]|jgi:tRNA threonylcarbamoyladenosine modification (KEOPS) complex  Pcc1 subunit|nr:hypothetical protein [Candidatus Parvarchaeota archaeon]MCL5018037.1 hypothetical protein [Candidatus Parvarchaeota archaeon]